MEQIVWREVPEWEVKMDYLMHVLQQVVKASGDFVMVSVDADGNAMWMNSTQTGQRKGVYA